MFGQQVQWQSAQAKIFRLARRAIVAGAGLFFAVCTQAQATPSPGDQFDYKWHFAAIPGIYGTASVIIGPLDSSTFYTIQSFAITQNVGFCGPCAPATQDASLQFFNAATTGLVGTVSGTYSSFYAHQFQFTFTDLVGGIGTWAEEDNGYDSFGVLKTTNNYHGTYTAVPEPLTLYLFGAGLFGLLALRRRRKPHATAQLV